MTDIATSSRVGNAPALASNGNAPAAAGALDETYTDMIMSELAKLRDCLARVGQRVVAFEELANDLDGQVTHVDEETTRVEAPADTRAAMDANVTVANNITRHARLVAQQAATAGDLTGLAREGMRPAVVTQDEMRMIGAGPKLLATARKN